MMNNVLLRYIYTAFLGILIVTFVGLGIETFYTTPQYPDYPEKLAEYYENCGREVAPDGKIMTCEQEKSEEIQQLEEAHNAGEKSYLEMYHSHSRNVSIIALVVSIFILVISLLFIDQLAMLADGVLVGGLLTLGYGIIRGFESDDPRFRFVIVAVGLLITFVLGYLKFVKPHQNETSTSL